MKNTQFIEFRDLNLIDSIQLFSSYLKADSKDQHLLESLKNDEEITFLVKRINNANNELDVLSAAKELVKTMKKKPEYNRLKRNVTKKQHTNFKELSEKIGTLHITNGKFSKNYKDKNDLLLIFLFGFFVGIYYNLFWYWLIGTVEKL